LQHHGDFHAYPSDDASIGSCITPTRRQSGTFTNPGPQKVSPRSRSARSDSRVLQSGVTQTHPHRPALVEAITITSGSRIPSDFLKQLGPSRRLASRADVHENDVRRNSGPYFRLRLPCRIQPSRQRGAE
jgi:hypothetical protein